MLTRKALILVKNESSYGVDIIPAPASDAVLVYDLSVTPDARMLQRQTLDSSLSRRSEVVGRKLVNIEFKTEIRGQGSALGTPPEVGPLFRACSMAETITASTKVDYKFISTGFESATIYAYMDGILHKIPGAYGTWSINAPAGQFGSITWRMQGLWTDPTDAAIPGGAVFDTPKPPMMQSALLTLGAFSTGVIESFTLDANVVSPEDPDLNSAEGLKGLFVNGRNPTGSINPKAVTEATHTFWANFKAGTEVAMTATFGTASLNRLKITSAPKVQYGAPRWGDRNGQRTYDLPFFLNRSTDAGDDELTLTYD